MIEATIATKNGDVFMVYADGFTQLINEMEPMAKDVVQVTGRVITGRVIKTDEMRQGKGTRRDTK